MGETTKTTPQMVAKKQPSSMTKGERVMYAAAVPRMLVTAAIRMHGITHKVARAAVTKYLVEHSEGFGVMDAYEAAEAVIKFAGIQDEHPVRSARQTENIECSKFDIAILEKPDVDGLNKSEMLALYGLLAEDEAYPIEISAKNVNSTAMGFITARAAETLQYMYGNDSGLGDFIASILDDMNLETENHVYSYEGLRIKLDR